MHKSIWIIVIACYLSGGPAVADQTTHQCVDFLTNSPPTSCRVPDPPAQRLDKQLTGPIDIRFGVAGPIPNQLSMPAGTTQAFYEIALLVDSDNNPATGFQGADSGINVQALCNGNCQTLSLVDNLTCASLTHSGSGGVFAATGPCQVTGTNPLTVQLSNFSSQQIAATVPGAAVFADSRIVANSPTALLALVGDITGNRPAAISFAIPDAVGDFSDQFNPGGIPAAGRAATDIVSVDVTFNGLSDNPPPSLSLALSNERPPPGAVVSLSWTSAGIFGTTCTPSGGAGTGWAQRGSLPLTGSVSETAPQSGSVSFTLTCGAVAATSNLTVTPTTQPPPVPPLAGLVSAGAGGAPLNGESAQPAISADGGRLAFVSTATNLLSNRADVAKGAVRRVFVRGQNGDIELASVNESGAALNVDSSNVALSADGATVAFDSADGQVRAYAGGLGRTQGVSTTPAGLPGNGTSANPALTGDGGTAVFDSTGDLGVLDPNGPTTDIFVKNLVTGAVNLLTLASDGGPANGPSSNPAVSSDGAVVAFQTQATNLVGSGPLASATAAKGGILQICAGRPNGRTQGCVSTNPATRQLGDLDSRNVALSADGRYAVFESDATNLVTGDTNGTTDVFWAELDSSLTVVSLIRASTTATGGQANGPSRAPQICGDGNQIIFESDASNLDSNDANGTADVFLKDIRTGQILRFDRTPGGSEPNGPSTSPVLSADCASIAFASDADNLIDGDSNGVSDVYNAPNPVIANPDEPAVVGLSLPPPVPANANCPAGYFITTITDGPGTGLRSGLYGLELLLDEPGTRSLSGGLNFGGLVDVGQVGFAGANIANATGENQRLNVSLTGNPITDGNGALPVRVTINRRTATASEAVFQSSVSITNAQPFETSIVVSPGYYEALVAPEGFPASAAGGQAEGQFFFSLTTSFVNRPGGGFQGGAVVGGYHANNPFGGVSGFAAFCIATPHTTSIRVLSAPSYGPAGAGDLQLELLDVNRNSVLRIP